MLKNLKKSIVSITVIHFSFIIHHTMYTWVRKAPVPLFLRVSIKNMVTYQIEESFQ